MHAHAHGHPHAPRTISASFATGIALNLAFVAVEALYGLRSHSLALLADAVHNLGDVLGLGLAWGALALASRPPTERHTYGFRRASILAALANAVVLLVAVGGIVLEASRRFGDAAPVAGRVVMTVAGIGIAVNGSSALMFLPHRGEDLNLRGAFLHLAADAGVAIGVLLSAWAILRTGWLWLDPAFSLLVSAIIVWSTWDLLSRSLRLAMDAVPEGVDLRGVQAYLRAIPGVTAVHDLHIWAMSTTEVALTAHLVRPAAGVDDRMLQAVCHDLRDRFRIQHVTIQVEQDDASCGQAPPHAV